MSLTLNSPDFAPGAEIPLAHTCEGADVSPELRWSGVPTGARSLVLIVDDPDAPDPAAPKVTWIHWVIYDIPATASALPRAARRANLPAGAHEGTNSWQKRRYNGPCPPIGRHRYFHKLFALDEVLGDRGALTQEELEAAMKGHVLARAELVGTYQKRGAGAARSA